MSFFVDAWIGELFLLYGAALLFGPDRFIDWHDPISSRTEYGRKYYLWRRPINRPSYRIVGAMLMVFGTMNILAVLGVID